MSLTYGSVCSGIEAASVAWHPLGWRPAWFAEVDKAASTVLAWRFPGVPNLGDMTLLAMKVRAREIPAPDVLVGGTPCQAFSVAGMRRGLADARGQLTLAYVDLANAIDEVRIADGLDPVVIVWENVPGVLTSRDNAFGCFLAAICGDDDPLEPGARPEHGRSASHWAWLKDAGQHRPKWPHAGYAAGPQRTVAWVVRDAQYFGLAQRRRRVFVVASARAGFDPATVLLEFDGVRRDSPPSRESGEGLTHPVAPCLTSSGRGVERTGDTRGQDAVVAVIDDGVSGGRFRGDAGLAFGGGRRGGAVDVAACLVAKGQKNDFEVETFVVEPALYAIMPMNSGRDYKAREVDVAQPLMAGGPLSGAQGGDYIVQTVAFGSKGAGLDATVDCAPTLRASGHAESHSNGGRTPAVAYAIQERAVCENPNAGPDGIGIRSDDCAYTLEARTVPQAVAVLPFDTTQITSPSNYSSPREGDPCHPLAAGAHPPAVCVTEPVTHTLKAEGFDASEDGTGRGQPITVAVCPTLRAGGNETGGDRPPGTDVDTADSLITYDRHMAVRRLMPVECERLQGFPDNWTLVPVKKVSKANQAKARADTSGMFAEVDGVMWTLAADGPRYKQCGNSMATNVMHWIGARIAAALAATSDDFDAMLGHNCGPALDEFEALLG